MAQVTSKSRRILANRDSPYLRENGGKRIRIGLCCNGDGVCSDIAVSEFVGVVATERNGCDVDRGDKLEYNERTGF